MKTVTVITMRAYHDGLTDEEVLSNAQYWSEKMEEALFDDTDVEVTIPSEQVTVATAPFKVE